ncbi:hypothetical protein QTP70_015518 [Hemibagrus guttatus]|uniref:AB hydrolase-1 domain-containing protein n=1 Tax=Hemibagrus guttatus TaxID=175788 RepID=A0AAE0QEE8_9TELE|nr:hypothetical protein QTP70_015518 [Hemibagrus guttatus]
MHDENESDEKLPRYAWWSSWRPTSLSILKNTETKILDRSRTPLVMVHGFGGGVGLWIRNLDPLCRSRPVFAFDLLGFGRSSHPRFSLDPVQAEQQSVSSIEHWRRALGLEKMILLGHSLGGYLATSYAIQYPERVCHLILVDPWGFEPVPREGVASLGFPRWVEMILSIASFFNPLAVVRATGPWGPKLISRVRPDFKRNFEELFQDDTIMEYIYHCNAQTPRERTGIRSQRLLDQLAAETVGSLPAAYQEFLNDPTVIDQWREGNQYEFSTLNISAAVEEWQEDERSILSFTTPELGIFELAEKRVWRVERVRPGRDAVEPAGVIPPAEGPRAAAAPDLTESEPQAQPAAQKPAGVMPAPEKPRTAEPAAAEPCSACQAGTKVQGNRMETPDTTPVQGDGGNVNMVDEPIFKVPNKRKKQGKGQGKKQAKKRQRWRNENRTVMTASQTRF